MSDLLNYAESIKKRDAGIKQAIDTTEEKHPDWKSRALAFLIKFPGSRFMTEDVREYAYRHGLDRPEHERAWGGVMVSAVNKKLITKVGFDSVKNPNAHRTPASVWEKTG